MDPKPRPTTAQLRNEARQAEQQCRWADAAGLWREAIAAYPERFRDTAIGQRDIAAMQARADADAAQAA